MNEGLGELRVSQTLFYGTINKLFLHGMKLYIVQSLE